MNIESIREFLGWCTVINVGIFAVTIIKVLAIGNWASKIHAKMFGIDEESVRQMYFQILSMYKIAFIILNLVPYLALSFMV